MAIEAGRRRAEQELDLERRRAEHEFRLQRRMDALDLIERRDRHAVWLAGERLRLLRRAIMLVLLIVAACSAVAAGFGPEDLLRLAEPR